MKKISILITGEIEFPDQMEWFVESAIKSNFVMGMPPMIVPPLTLRYTGVQKLETA